MRPWLLALLPLGAWGCERIVGVDDLRIVRQVENAAGAGGQAGAGGAIPCAADATPCGACIEENCCAPALACSQDVACSACLDDPASGGCAADALLAAYRDCARAKCPACGP